MGQAVFDAVADALEARTDLDKLEARGTVRLALREAGLEARSVTAEQICVVVEKLMPAELRSRGISAPEGVCAALCEAARRCASDPGPGDSSPEEIFRRLAGA